MEIEKFNCFGQGPACQSICYFEVSLSYTTITSSTEIIKSANKMISDFMILWKSKDKVKIVHLESLIQSLKMPFLKRSLDPRYAVDWNPVLDTLLNSFGGPYLLK